MNYAPLTAGRIAVDGERVSDPATPTPPPTAVAIMLDRAAGGADRHRCRPYSWGDGCGDCDVGVGEQGEGHVPVPGVVASDLVVIESDLVLRGLEAFLYRPPGPATPDEVGVVFHLDADVSVVDGDPDRRAPLPWSMALATSSVPTVRRPPRRSRWGDWCAVSGAGRGDLPHRTRFGAGHVGGSRHHTTAIGLDGPTRHRGDHRWDRDPRMRSLLRTCCARSVAAAWLPGSEPEVVREA